MNMVSTTFALNNIGVSFDINDNILTHMYCIIIIFSIIKLYDFFFIFAVSKHVSPKFFENENRRLVLVSISCTHISPCLVVTMYFGKSYEVMCSNE